MGIEYRNEDEDFTEEREEQSEEAEWRELDNMDRSEAIKEQQL